MILRIISFLVIGSLLCDVVAPSSIIVPRPGKCKRITQVTRCNFCKIDQDCSAPEKCCGGCCSADLINVTCTDRRGVIVGDCVLPVYCQYPNVISARYQCPKPWRKQGCKCCVPGPRTTTTTTTTTKRPVKKPGKCPNVPRVCFPPQCANDFDCKGRKKCCNRCCMEPKTCEDKARRISGLCRHPQDCHFPYHKYDIGCKSQPWEPKCICCALPPPTTTTTTTRPPFIPCFVRWGNRVWTGICISKKKCRWPFPYNYKCKGKHGCPRKKICCFRDSDHPPKDHCKGKKG